MNEELQEEMEEGSGLKTKKPLFRPVTQSTADKNAYLKRYQKFDPRSNNYVATM